MVIREFGGPQVMHWEELPTPTPGPGEVLIRVHAVSVNRTLDLQVRLDGGGFVTLDVKRLYQYRLRVMSGLGTERREDLDRALQLAAAGEFRVLIDRIMPLTEAAAAHRLVEQNVTLGKVILDPTLTAPPYTG
jgi:NADPH:quinone reductase-like Zn-dependent oxidoreductase